MINHSIVYLFLLIFIREVMKGISALRWCLFLRLIIGQPQMIIYSQKQLIHYTLLHISI